MEANLSGIGYDNYKIDCHGTITNIKRNKVVKPDINWAGYHRVMLYKDGCPKRFSVHRLVAEMFLENPENKACVNHKDLNKGNNYIFNLEWATHKENSQHAFVNNALKIPMKLSVEAIEEIQSTKRKTKHLSEKYGVSKTTIKYWRKQMTQDSFVKE